MGLRIDLNIDNSKIDVTHVILYIDKKITVNNEDGSGKDLPLEGVSENMMNAYNTFIDALAIETKSEYETKAVTKRIISSEKG